MLALLHAETDPLSDAEGVLQWLELSVALKEGERVEETLPQGLEEGVIEGVTDSDPEAEKLDDADRDALAHCEVVTQPVRDTEGDSVEHSDAETQIDGDTVPHDETDAEREGERVAVEHADTLGEALRVTVVHPLAVVHMEAEEHEDMVRDVLTEADAQNEEETLVASEAD